MGVSKNGGVNDRNMVIWGFPKMEGYPKSSKSRSEVDYFTTETHGDLGIPHFKKPPYSFV
jgi:hypothetical protein